MAKIDRFLNALENGRDFTANQVRATFGLQSVYHAVRRLRLEGFAIYTNKRVNQYGESFRVYKLGRASQRFTRNYWAGRSLLANKALYRTA